MSLAVSAAAFALLVAEASQAAPPVPEDGGGGAPIPWILIAVAALVVLMGLAVVLRRLR